MSESDKPPNSYRRTSTLRTLLGSREDMPGPLSKLGQYIFVVSLILMALTALALINAYFHIANITSYDIDQTGSTSPFLLAGYVGMFITIAFLPIPDYFLLPAYGYLASLGVFDPYTTFIVCLLAAILPLEYIPGRFAGRPLLLKGLKYFGISERMINSAEKWLEDHGRFSIFISTFIPFFYSVTSLAAGTLKMNAAEFLVASAVGFGVRYAFLEYIGYHSIFIFTYAFDYSNRTLLFLLLIVSALYAGFYLFRAWRPGRTHPAP